MNLYLFIGNKKIILIFYHSTMLVDLKITGLGCTALIESSEVYATYKYFFSFTQSYKKKLGVLVLIVARKLPC